MITIISNSTNILQFKVSETSGVYFLRRAGQLVYIGKSINVFSRIFGNEHMTTKAFDEVEIHWMKPELLTKYEKEQIQLHKPPLNVLKRSKPRNVIAPIIDGIAWRS